MNWLTKISVVFLLLTAFNPLYAAGLLTPSDQRFPILTLRDHQVNVVVEDGYAITTVEQVFHNPHGQDLEAIYSFPVPQHGAVSEFTMWIDGKPVVAEVFEKQEARRIYEEEKQRGRDAGITEKDAYRSFDISVSPVRAGQDTRVRLSYMQAAHVDLGMGRYLYPLEEGGVDEQKLAFWTMNDKVEGLFEFNLTLRSAYPIGAVRVPQGNAVVQQQGPGEWTVSMSNRAGSTQVIEEGQEGATAAGIQPQYRLNEDIVVYWRHQAGLPGSVDLVTYKPDANEKGTFMMVVTPGDDLKNIQRGSDWVFVLDVSGSMKGKYATLAEGIKQALGQLRAEDRFRIVLFNNRDKELTRGYVNASSENIRRYSDEVAAVVTGGGTNLYGGLERGLSVLDSDRTSSIVLVTDGVANIGHTEKKAFLNLLKKRDVRLFTFMMGNSSNTPLLEGLAKHTNGFALSVSNSDDIVGHILNATQKVSHEALHGVEVDISGVRVSDLTPEHIGSLYRGQQLILFGHYWGSGQSHVKIKGKISGDKKIYSTRFNFPEISHENPEIERLWAYATIEAIQDEAELLGEEADQKQAIVDIATEYGLVTDHTSMVVMREEAFVERGVERRNQQRVAVEHAAQQQRAAQAPVSRRADEQQPMFNQPRASHQSSGGGSLDLFVFLIMFAAFVIAARSRRFH